MNRREVLKSVGLIVGGTVVGADAFLSGCSFREETKGLLSQTQIDVLEDIAETILPHTDKSPGAKDAGVGQFMNKIVSDFYTIPEQQVFLAAIASYRAIKFSLLSPEDKEALLLSKEANAEAYPVATYVNQDGEHFETRPAYIMIKQLSIWGYLSSEIVAKNNYNFLPIPGKYENCVTVTNDTKPMYYNPWPGAALRS